MFCTGTTVELVASPGTFAGAITSYRWTGPNGFTSTDQGFTFNNATSIVSGAYNLTATFAGSCSATVTSSRTIQVGEPSLSIINTPYACTGGQLSLGASLIVNNYTSTIPATYRWTGPNGFASTAKDITLTNMTSAMAGTYSVTAILSGICASTLTTSTQAQITKPFIRVVSQQTGGISSGSQYCPGTSINLYPVFFANSSGFPSNRSTLIYQWSGPNGFSSSVQQPTIPTASTLSSGAYSLTITVTGECSGDYTATAVIKVGKPSSNVLVNTLSGIAQNDTYCPGATVFLQATNFPSTAPVISYRWSGPSGFTSSAQSLTLTNISPSMTGVYSLTTVYGGACASTRVEFANINVSTPKVYTMLYLPNGNGICGGGSQRICPGDYYRLSPCADPLYSSDLLIKNTYEWTLPNGTTSTSPSLTIASATLADAGRYILKTTMGGVCEPAITRDTTTIVLGTPAPKIRTGNPFISNGRSTTLYTDNCTGSNVQWSSGQTGGSIIVTPNQTTTYTATCLNYGSCPSPPSNPLTVQVSTQPEADLSILLSASSRTPKLGQPVTVTLLITNSSTEIAHNVRIESRLPDLLSVINAGDLQFDGSIISTTVANVPANGTVNLSFQVVANTASQIWLAAQIMASDNPDPDSWPASGTNDGQDDAAWLDLRTSSTSTVVSKSPEPNPAYLPAVSVDRITLPSNWVDLNLDMSASKTVVDLNEIVTITLWVDNYDNKRLLSPEITCLLPEGLAFVGGTDMVATGQQIVLTGGQYYPQWPQTFTFQVKATGPITETIKARISHCDWDDVDSDPTNGFDTGEDDTVQIRLRMK
ncbi:hypothetical protein GO730_11810 [Spirosoma sp. HMF3257]|uniref:DUF11 domain-containing protein n=1 Tax=Spirosoma telluris TaxID=2183553 RepID=UPI0011B94651|nr:hypothetical protein [Spirosoma telluris]